MPELDQQTQPAIQRRLITGMTQGETEAWVNRRGNKS